MAIVGNRDHKEQRMLRSDARFLSFLHALYKCLSFRNDDTTMTICWLVCA